MVPQVQLLEAHMDHIDRYVLPSFIDSIPNAANFLLNSRSEQPSTAPTPKT